MPRIKTTKDFLSRYLDSDLSRQFGKAIVRQVVVLGTMNSILLTRGNICRYFCSA
jgi:hypothetical protein